MLVAYTLFSSSSGNCTYVKSGNTEILIDAGKSARAIESALLSVGSSIKNISHIFITHEHGDHICGLEMLTKKHLIPVHFTYPSYDKCISATSNLKKCALRHEIEYRVEIGNLTVSSFKIPHDSACNVGYIVKDKDSSLGTATDIGHITEGAAMALKDCNYIILESNHDIEMVKNGKYPQAIKERILGEYGHLSNKNAARLACFFAENGAKALTLAHLSRENNAPELALKAVSSLLENNSLQIDLTVACPDTPVLVTR